MVELWVAGGGGRVEIMEQADRGGEVEAVEARRQVDDNGGIWGNLLVYHSVEFKLPVDG